MIRRAIDWLLAEIATPTVGQLADRLELAEGAAARDAAQIEALTERLAQSEAARFALAAQLAEACRERDVALSDERNAERGRESAWAVVDAKNAALSTIATLGAASRNGTARKLARIAREAME